MLTTRFTDQTHRCALHHALLAALLASGLVAQVRELPSPAGPQSGQPNLTTGPDGRLFLSWIEHSSERHSLRFTVRKGDDWSAPRIIAKEDKDWFVNWADFPSMIALPDGTMAAHWLVKSGSGTFDYDVSISRSFDGGATWTPSLVPHRDGVQAEHGFVSLFAGADDVLSAVWLDGREMKPADQHSGRGDMTLRFVEVLRDGTLQNPAVLDARVCECCQTSAAMTKDGPIVAYRDRSGDEVRDISIVRRVDGRWTEPRPVVEDGWKIHGCPVNGPSVAAVERRVAVAWFTAAGGEPRVLLAVSKDAGATFGEPITIDDSNPAGRVEVLLHDNGSIFVCWLATTASGGAIRLRQVAPDGTVGTATTIADSGTARGNGFPQMARHGEELVFAWTSKGVQTAALPLR